MTQDDPVLGRSIGDSVRLYAEHLLWKLHRGYELHPDIEVTDNTKIAELGTGTAVWLMDLARQLPPTVELHGYDICDDQFPQKELWPKNVKLSLLDSLSDPPASLEGQYDAVHLRMWASNLRDGDISGIINHAKKLLKPGGYIQWEDADLVHQRIEGTEAEEFERDINHLFTKVDLDYGWVSDLPNRLREEKFKIIESENGFFKPELVQLCTNTYLMALRVIIQDVKRQLAQNLQLSISELEVALYRMSLQNSAGFIYNWSPVAVLAQVA
ncbi:uncharacterized protein N7484_002967 [Penicillium longicatenatum]|uniref:uncharacterized protein n=1 Tax=Penicillium longicatenatum TaxID=1561947 RepID=UPI002546DDBD|nr:uncharacterized protein N7484_002967 [Penicillium longicatenatum]KAJ5649244.1 hypothetical protein N7484_002967 [Penicillium longicatenatum]